MTRPKATEARVLVIDPTHRGFGYVIFEGPDFLIDWGVRQVEGPKNKGSIAAVAELIARYHPRILVLEDVAEKGCRRRRRVRVLLDGLEQYGRERGLTVRRIPQTAVKKTLLYSGIRNKNQMVRFVAARFPELGRYLPPDRKPWMSEDVRMATFDAAAFALTFFWAASEKPEATPAIHRQPQENTEMKILEFGRPEVDGGGSGGDPGLEAAGQEHSRDRADARRVAQQSTALSARRRAVAVRA